MTEDDVVQPTRCPVCGGFDCTQTQAFAARQRERIESLQASIDFLGNAGKPERERWVVRELLQNLGHPFMPADITSVVDEPPDVAFGDARFEIKELYDDGRRRMDEYRARLREAERARRCTELLPLSPYSPQDTSLDEVLELAVSTGHQHATRYDRRLVPTLDLLLYHNLQGVMEMPDYPVPSAAHLCGQGWRSVTVVFGFRAIVFCAATDAPMWLQSATGRVVHRAV
jgi:Putative endonuclease, protein of unknown function (DUF1780)